MQLTQCQSLSSADDGNDGNDGIFCGDRTKRCIDDSRVLRQSSLTISIYDSVIASRARAHPIRWRPAYLGRDAQQRWPERDAGLRFQRHAVCHTDAIT
jgi:hypothetical protein